MMPRTISQYFARLTRPRKLNNRFANALPLVLMARTRAGTKWTSGGGYGCDKSMEFQGAMASLPEATPDRQVHLDKGPMRGRLNRLAWRAARILCVAFDARVLDSVVTEAVGNRRGFAERPRGSRRYSGPRASVW